MQPSGTGFETSKMSVSDPPVMSSMTMQTSVPSAYASMHSTTLGCFDMACRPISFNKSFNSAIGATLRATTLPERLSVAEYTIPEAPWPRISRLLWIRSTSSRRGQTQFLEIWIIFIVIFLLDHHSITEISCYRSSTRKLGWRSLNAFHVEVQDIQDGLRISIGLFFGNAWCQENLSHRWR